jgi:DNA mismatch repair protein MutS2
VNEQTIAKLEFNVIRQVLADHSSTGLGRRLALALKPSPKSAQVRIWLDQVRELTTVAQERSMPPLGGIHDVRDEILACSFPTPLEPDALARVGETLDATANLRAWFDRLGDLDAPADGLIRLGRRVGDFGLLGGAITQAIDPRGEVRDSASERLASIRRSIDQTKNQSRGVFDRLLRKSSLRNMLQYAGTTLHNDRMVLPLKTEYRGRIPGIVHRSSDSGATLFIEPAESVELNNTIIKLRQAESVEITRILSELCRKVHAEQGGILETLQAVSVLDLLVAKCRYAKNRRCVCPEIDDAGVLDLHDARHPVLIEVFDREAMDGHPPKAVVPIDVRLGDDFDVLAITGPNTGGKTVALKTVGLLALMTQAGIPIPVGEGSKMPVYRQVFVDIGDEQSLQQSLSTFSSHLSNQLRILEASGEGTLVLIDELGAGTDPDEGAAIGQAIIAELLHKKARAIVTTHLSALKAVAFTTDRVDNASVEFDVASLRPTYRLQLGEPGNSNALIIAQRLGMAPRLIQLAKSRLDERHQHLTRAIAGTLESRRDAERARKDAREAALESRKLQEELARRDGELQRERDAFGEWTKWLNTLRPGDMVFLRSMKRAAKVVRMQLQKQTALVSTGAVDYEVPLQDIQSPPEDSA